MTLFSPLFCSFFALFSLFFRPFLLFFTPFLPFLDPFLTPFLPCFPSIYRGLYGPWWVPTCAPFFAPFFALFGPLFLRFSLFFRPFFAILAILGPQSRKVIGTGWTPVHSRVNKKRAEGPHRCHFARVAACVRARPCGTLRDPLRRGSEIGGLRSNKDARARARAS